MLEPFLVYGLLSKLSHNVEIENQSQIWTIFFFLMNGKLSIEQPFLELLILDFNQSNFW